MSEVHVPFGDSAADTATLLLAAAEELDGFEANVVKVNHDNGGGFTVPEEVAKAAKLKPEDPNAEFQAEVDSIKEGSELPSQTVTSEEAEVKQQADLAAKAPAKKAAAKKSTAKGK
jgi:hypothetical protein